MHRRDFLAVSASATLAAAAAGSASGGSGEGFAPKPGDGKLKGAIKHSVCRWCFGGMSLDDLCKNASEMGISSVELLNPDEFDVPRKYGIGCALANPVKSNPIGKGLNRIEHHDAIIRELEERLPLVKAAGVPQQIVFSGNRGGMDDKEGLKNCAIGLKRITPLAEQLGITIVMELLNSKVDHGDYMCDRTPWGVELVKQVGSARFKLLYDIYHMQIMEGDVIRTITDNFEHIGHYHTAGVPGRHEIDEKQELNYKAISAAIAAKKFGGFLAQEFIPQRDAMKSLREAVVLCDV